MFIVLCASNDHAALWAWEGLKLRGLEPIELVTSEALAFARGWEHRVGASGAHVKIALQDAGAPTQINAGRVLCGSRIRGVLNRLSWPSSSLISHAAPSDREYSSCEIQAFYLSWLNSLSGVIVNRPNPGGLSGAWRHASEWAVRANRAGLSVPPYRQSARDSADRGYGPLTPEAAVPESLIVLRDRVFGANVPASVEAACLRLARGENLEMLGVDLYRNPRGEWMFGHANPSPHLQLGGEPLLDRLAELFLNGDAK